MNDLSLAQIEKFLGDHYIGRIGCYSNGKVYIVPVTYFYDKDSRCILGHSSKGMKIDIMRQYPEVCFQVDNIRNVSSWESVIAWGTFEELGGADAKNASHLFVKGLQDIMNRPENHEHVTFLRDITHTSAATDASVIYRIRLRDLTGKSEEKT